MSAVSDVEATGRPRYAPTLNGMVGMIARVMLSVLLAGGMPWLSLIVTQRMGGVAGAGQGAKGAVAVQWLILFVGLVRAATFAGFGLGISAVLCPADAYECPL